MNETNITNGEMEMFCPLTKSNCICEDCAFYSAPCCALVKTPLAAEGVEEYMLDVTDKLDNITNALEHISKQIHNL